MARFGKVALCAAALALAACGNSLGIFESRDLRAAAKEEAPPRAPADAGVDASQPAWGELPRCPAPDAGPTKQSQCAADLAALADAAAPAPDGDRIWRLMERAIVDPPASCRRPGRDEPFDSGGRWVIRFIVNADGVVERAGVIDFQPTLPGSRGRSNAEFEACIVRAVCNIRFPPEPGRRPIQVTYPLHVDTAD